MYKFFDLMLPPSEATSTVCDIKQKLEIAEEVVDYPVTLHRRQARVFTVADSMIQDLNFVFANQVSHGFIAWAGNRNTITWHRTNLLAQMLQMIQVAHVQ